MGADIEQAATFALAVLSVGFVKSHGVDQLVPMRLMVIAILTVTAIPNQNHRRNIGVKTNREATRARVRRRPALMTEPPDRVGEE